MAAQQLVGRFLTFRFWEKVETAAVAAQDNGAVTSLASPSCASEVRVIQDYMVAGEGGGVALAARNGPRMLGHPIVLARMARDRIQRAGQRLRNLDEDVGRITTQQIAQHCA